MKDSLVVGALKIGEHNLLYSRGILARPMEAIAKPFDHAKRKFWSRGADTDGTGFAFIPDGGADWRRRVLLQWNSYAVTTCRLGSGTDRRQQRHHQSSMGKRAAPGTVDFRLG